MPTYSYRCTVCDHAFDIQQAFSDDSLSVCPECQGALRKVFNSIGVTFQGSGFYRTDSRAEAKGAAGKKASSLPATKSESSSGTSHTTPSAAPSSNTGPAARETPKKTPSPTAS